MTTLVQFVCDPDLHCGFKPTDVDVPGLIFSTKLSIWIGCATVVFLCGNVALWLLLIRRVRSRLVAIEARLTGTDCRLSALEGMAPDHAPEPSAVRVTLDLSADNSRVLLHGLSIVGAPPRDEEASE